MPPGGASGTERVVRADARTHAIAFVTAIGSVPLHLIPLVIAVLVAANGYSAMAASLVVSAMLAGDLAATVLLALAAVRVDRRDVLLPALTLFALAIALSASAADSSLIYPLWAAIGALAGVIGQAGTLFAAYASNPERIFALRLSYVLAISGLAALALLLPLPVTPFARMTLAAMVLTLLALGCLFLLTPRSGPRPRLQRAAPTRPSPLMVAGLLALVFIMVGHTGFLSQMGAYFDQGADDGLDRVALVVGIGKLVIGGMVSIVFAMLGTWSLRKQMLVSLALAAAMLSLVSGPGIALAIVFFACYELGLNTFSPLFAGRIAAKLDDYWKHWIGFSVFLGALLGPPVCAWLMDMGGAAGPAALGIASLAVAALWSLFSMSGRHRAGRPLGA